VAHGTVDCVQKKKTFDWKLQRCMESLLLDSVALQNARQPQD